MYKYYLLFILVGLLFSCNSSKKLGPFVQNNSIYIEKNKAIDDNKLLIDAVSLAKQKSIKNIYIKKGKYYLSSQFLSGVINMDINLIGEDGVVFYCNKRIIDVSAPSVLQKTRVSLKKGISVMNNPFRKDIDFNDDIFCVLIDDGLVEKAWKYKKGEMLSVKKITRNKIEFNEKSLFPYSNVRIKLYESRSIALKNIEFVINYKSSFVDGGLMKFEGCKLTLENVKTTDLNKDKKKNFLLANNCNNTLVKEFEIEGYQYGVILNYSLNARFLNIKSDHTLHPIVPATFSKNIYTDKLTGTDTAIDAHPSFNITYKNVNIDKGGFNCRSFGVYMENCVFTNPEFTNKTYLGVTSLTDEFKYLAKEYDIVLKNVDWVIKRKGVNGLHIKDARRFNVQNCITHQVSIEGNASEIKISDSKIGRFQNSQTNCVIENTIFDSKLQQLFKPIPPLSFSRTGSAKIVNCEFKGYENTFLISYLHSPLKSSLTFRNCQFGEFKDWINKFGSKTKEYKNIHFENCDFVNVPKFSKQLNSIEKDILSKNRINKKN